MSHLDSHHAARIKERAQKVLGGSGQKEADQEKIYNEMREILKEQDRSVLDHVCPMFVAMERSHNQKLILALFSLFLPRCSMEIAGTVLRHYLARMTFLVETCRSDPSPGLSPDVLESSLIVQTMISFIRDLIPRQLYSDELMEKKPNKSKITWVFEPCYRGVVEGRKVLGKMLRAEGENKRSAMVYLRPTGVQIFKDLQSSRNLVEKLSDTDCDLRYGDHKTFSSVVNTLVQMMADQMPLDSFQRFLSVLPLFHSSSLSSSSSSFQPQGRFDQVKSPDGMGGSPLVSGSTPSPGSSIGFSPYQASTPPQHPLGINSSSSNPVGSSLGRTESGTTQRMMAMENGKSSMKGLPLLEACVKRTIHLIENSKVTDNQPLKELDWDTFMALSDSWLGNWLSFASMMYVFIEWHMLDLDQYLARLHQEMESLEGPNSRDNRVLWTILVCIPLKTPRESFSSDLNPDDLFLSSLLFSFVNERQAVTRNSVLFDVAVAALRMRISTMPECQSSPQVFQLLSPHQPYCDHFLNLLRVWYDKMRNQDLTNFHFIEHEMLCSLANCSSLPVSSEIIKSLSNSGKSKMYPIEFLSFLPHRVQRRITQRLSSSQRVAMPATTESLEYFVRALYLTDDMKIYFKFQTMACLPYVEILTFRLIRLLPYEPSSLINEMCSYPQAPNSQAPKGLGSQDQVRDRLADLLKTKLLLNMKEVSGVHNSKHVAGYRLHFRMVLLGLAKCLNVYGIVDYNQIKGLKKFIDRVKNVNYWHPKTIRFMPAMMRDRLVGHETRPSLVGSEVLANSNALAQQFQTSNVLEMCTKDPSLKHVLLSVLFFNSSHNNSPALADFLAQIPFLDLIENITVLVENVIRIAEAGDCEMTQIVEILNDLVWRHKVVPFHHLIFGLLERDDHPSCFEIINLLLFGTSVNGGTFSERFDAFIALNINPSFWKEDNFSEKSLKYFEQFPPRNSMEQSKKTAPKYEMDPLCFLTVLDVLVGRLIEFGNEALLNDVVIRFMPLYRYHDFPLTFIKNLLVYYDRSSSPDPFSSEPSFFLGIAVINSLFEFLEPQEFASIVEITQSPADQLSYLLWTRFIDRLANAIDSTKQHKSDVFQRFQEFPTKAKRELYLCVIGLLIIKNNLPHLDIASLILENLHGQLNVVLMPIHFCHLEAVGMIFAELPEPFHSSFLRYHSEIISKDPFLLDAVDHFNCEGAAAEYYYGMITGEYEEEVEGNRHQLYVNSVVMMHNFFTYSSLSVFESFFVDLILPYFDSPDKGPSIVYLFMLCKIVGPWVYRLGTKRRVIGKILEELFKYLQKVDEQRGWSGDSSALSVRLLDVVDDFFHHLKSIYNNKLSDTFNRLNDTAKKLSPALARRFAYVYSP